MVKYDLITPIIYYNVETEMNFPQYVYSYFIDFQTSDYDQINV